MIDMNETGDRISCLRKKRGLTQAMLAEQLDISAQAISKWERGQAFPDVSRLDELAKLLRVDVAYLLVGEQQSV